METIATNQNNEKTAVDAIIRREVLKITGITESEFTESLKYLAKLLKKRFLKNIPLQYNDISRIHRINDLANNLRKLEKVKGFEKFLRLFNNPEERNHTFFVAEIAGKLIERVDSLELEPDNGDILIVADRQPIRLECKSLEYSRKVKQVDAFHDKLWKELEPFLPKDGKQIDIELAYIPSETELKPVAKHIIEIITQSNGLGVTRTADGTKIMTRTRRYINTNIPNLAFFIKGATEESGLILPATTIATKDISVTIAGPHIDETSKLEKLIGKARKQMKEDIPIVVIVNISHIFGRISYIINQIRRRFQPKINTRINAIVFVSIVTDAHGKIMSNQIILNPFEKKPLGFRLTKLFDFSELPQA